MPFNKCSSYTRLDWSASDQTSSMYSTVVLFSSSVQRWFQRRSSGLLSSKIYVSSRQLTALQYEVSVPSLRSLRNLEGSKILEIGAGRPASSWTIAIPTWLHLRKFRLCHTSARMQIGRSTWNWVKCVEQVWSHLHLQSIRPPASLCATSSFYFDDWSASR